MLMATGDMGFVQMRKYDLEVWAAGSKRWLEVSSCSNFEAFQARRASIRMKSGMTRSHACFCRALCISRGP